MSRFFRFSRIRPSELYRERLRQMRRAASLSLALLPGIAVLLLLGGRFLPRGTQAASSGDAELRTPSTFAALPSPAPEGASAAGAAAANSAALSRLPLPDAADILPPTPEPASDALTAPLEGSRLAERPPQPVENAAAELRENVPTAELQSARASASEPPLPDTALSELLSLAPAPSPTESPEPAPTPADTSAPAEPSEPTGRAQPPQSAATSPPGRRSSTRRSSTASTTSASSDSRRSRGTSPSAAQGASSRASAASSSATAGGADEAPDTPPRYRKAPPPPYPAAMRARHYRGEVVVLIEVGADGRPGSVRILRSAGREELDCAARDWILAHWSFYPAVRDGRRVASRVRTSIRFEGR